MGQRAHFSQPLHFLSMSTVSSCFYLSQPPLPSPRTHPPTLPPLPSVHYSQKFKQDPLPTKVFFLLALVVTATGIHTREGCCVGLPSASSPGAGLPGSQTDLHIKAIVPRQNQEETRFSKHRGKALPESARQLSGTLGSLVSWSKLAQLTSLLLVPQPVRQGFF